MTALTSLFLDGVRNLKQTTLELGPNLNILYGENGAGKSSVLEAIHILSTGRSFRTRHIKNIIQHQQQAVTVSGVVSSADSETRIGIEKSPQKTTARLNRAPVQTISDLSKVLPLVVLHPSSYTLLTGEPAKRRAYLDWGAFHYDADFLSHWRAYNRVLEQRNAALRALSSAPQILLWDDQLIEHGIAVHEARECYLEQLNLTIPGLQEDLGFEYQINCSYRSGWGEHAEFAVALSEGLQRDRQLKYTYSGPHRGDLVVRLDKHKADAVASRGQLKLTTLLLKLAQAVQYRQTSATECLLLLDDLSSEFDEKHLEQITKTVLASGSQCLITTVNPESIPNNMGSAVEMFHVEQGKIIKTS